MYLVYVVGLYKLNKKKKIFHPCEAYRTYVYYMGYILPIILHNNIDITYIYMRNKNELKRNISLEMNLIDVQDL